MGDCKYGYDNDTPKRPSTEPIAHLLDSKPRDNRKMHQAQDQVSLCEALKALFDFIDKEVEVKN